MNRKIFTIPVIVFFIFSLGFKADKPAYRIFNVKGRAADYEALLKEAKKSDIILFGEIHNNPICHWLELELAKDLFIENNGKLVLGAEMFESDNQLILDEYLQKKIRKKDFEAEAKLWKNYPTDYAPLVNFAREKGIRFAATNVPRRFAAMVNQKGFEGLDSLTSREKELFAPLPVPYDSTLDCYKNMLKSMGEGAAAHAGPNIAKAQAFKDATMAHFILASYSGKMQLVHYNGSYHSDDFQGISWYLKEYSRNTPKPLRIMTISSVEQDTPEELSKEYVGKADFILCIPESMTKTQPQ